MQYSHRAGLIVPFAHKFKKQLTLAVAAVFLASMAAFTLSASAASTVINDANYASEGWQVYTTTGGQVEFVEDATAPSGSGSLHLTTIDDNDSRARFYKDLATPVALDEVTDAGYFSKVVDANIMEGSVSYYMQIDTDGDVSTAGDSTSLVHEPYWQNDKSPDPAPVVRDVWQEWDVLSGWYWSSQTTGGFTAGSGGPPHYSLSESLAIAPDAVVTGIGVYIGSYNPGYDTYADVISFNGDEYDLEAFVDTEKPVIEFVDPSATGMTVSGVYTVKTHATDNDLLKRMAVNVYNEANDTFLQPCGSTPADSSLGVAEHEFTCDLDTTSLPDGIYTLRASARDESDNVKAVSTKIVVDNTIENVAPVVELTNPTEGDELSGEVMFTGTVTDDNNVKHRFLVRDQADDNNVVYNSGNMFDDSAVVNASHEFDTASLPDGEYRVVLIGFDEETNARDRANVTFENYVDSKDECKNGGWERGTFDGEEFRNQGDCIKHFAPNNHHHSWWKVWKWNWWNRGWGWFGHQFNWGWSWWR